ncbi:NIF family HAD-type phosphatase [Rubrivivax gelatinosus]|uniref:FCP1 homology domain-containing protein n=1 Tax=Rubrivivax gelatinosus (strain NBRC 100245 / IL144) TaxID=983917 RepID=I0HQ33_RUBGI|nr:NIF family HAD-type phosphatase [Rubrivivax gelatinosus]BAL95120.1 hypothetical protein RGE_17790 [Rubrivivax gelatinosus IL144]
MKPTKPERQVATPQTRTPRTAGDITSSSTEKLTQDSAPPRRPTVLALDLEFTLISSAVSQIPRPGLFSFLKRCKELFPRIVIFTSVPEGRFREIAKTLTNESVAPDWFLEVEYISWSGATKDLRFIDGCDVEDVLLIDDLASYVHEGQEKQWIAVEAFDPRNSGDLGLGDLTAKLEQRLINTEPLGINS